MRGGSSTHSALRWPRRPRCSLRCCRSLVTKPARQRTIRWRRLDPEITGFELVISVLIETAHIVCFETEKAQRRKVFVDVSQIEAEVVAASEVIGLIEHRTDLRLRDR